MSNVLPIMALNPYVNRFTIKARVTHKGDVRTWNNQRGSGRLFSADLIDENVRLWCDACTCAALRAHITHVWALTCAGHRNPRHILQR